MIEFILLCVFAYCVFIAGTMAVCLISHIAERLHGDGQPRQHRQHVSDAQAYKRYMGYDQETK